MDKLELILLDQDLDYARSLRDYIRTLSSGEAITLKQFTKLETAEMAIKHAGACSVLLVAEAGWPLEITAEQPVCVLLEEPEQALNEKPEKGQPWFIYKYQPLEQFMAKVRKLAAAQSSGTLSDLSRDDGGPRIISWYSASGGGGKTTAAFNLAHQLAQRGEEVCLVSLEAVPSGFWGERDDGQQLAEWLYFAKTKPAIAAERISQVLLPNSGNRLYFAAPFTNSADARDMGNEDAKLLLKSLRDTKFFTWIVVDTEAGWSPRVLGALEASDLICWIVLDDWPSFQKTSFILEQWKQERIDQSLMPRTIFFYGKYLGETRCRYNELGVTPDAALPYVPHWKTLQRPEETLKAAFYSQQLWHGVQTALKRHERRTDQWSMPS